MEVVQQNVSDVIVLLDGLQTVELILWSPSQQIVAVVYFGDDRTVGYCFCNLQRQGVHTTLNSLQLAEALAD